MGIIEAIILGIVQGLTEFIPVSSSGHLLLFQHAFGVAPSGLTFDIALHVGTLGALLTYFWRDILWLLGSLAKKGKERRLPLLIAASTIPAAVAGYLLEDAAESTFRSPLLVAFNLAFFGCVMLFAEKVSSGYVKKTKSIDDITASQALTIGVAQAAAVVPGVSRSGSTITAGLFMGLNHTAATRFSFLLGMPIMAGAAIKVLATSESIKSISDQKMLFTVGVFVAFFTGLLAIRFMLRYLSKHTLKAFAYYRLAVAAVTVICLLIW